MRFGTSTTVGRAYPRAVTLLSCAVALLGAFSIEAANQLKIGQGAADAGGGGLVPLSLSADSTAVAFQFDLRYDPNLITAGAVFAEDRSGRYIAAGNEVSPGLHRYLLYSLQNAPITNGVVLALQFSPRPGSAGKTVQLTATNVILASSSATAIAPVELIAGSFSTSADQAAKFSSITRLSSTQLEIQLQASEGRTFTIQFSPNLKDWTPLSTNTVPAGGVLKLTTPFPAQTPARFFRGARQ